MSSHREAPEISKDPVADNTDTYAFVSPDKRDTVTIITNYVPLEAPAPPPKRTKDLDTPLNPEPIPPVVRPRPRRTRSGPAGGP